MLHEGLELDLEREAGERFRLRLGAAAYRSSGAGAFRGFRVSENDAGVVGETFADPNADTYRRGRLFSDRAYTVKVAASYRSARDLRLGLAVRYQDGQPFARLVVYPSLSQGAEAVQAVRRGDHRFTYTLTLDARVEQGFRLGPWRLAGILEAFNLLGMRNEVEEDVVSGEAFRRVSAVQPPRAVRLGLRLDR